MRTRPPSCSASRTCRRALRRLPGKVAASAVAFVYGPLAADPSRVGRPLRRVYVLAIGYRADLYRRG